LNFLSEIVDEKQRRLELAKQSVSLADLRETTRSQVKARKSHVLREALSSRANINIIAEFKRRSPSKGPIRAGAVAENIAREYVAGGAVAISVLTEENYFDGSLEDLRSIRSTVDVPILRKDFVFDEYQIYEAAAAGADAVLLIVAALEDEQLVVLRRLIEDGLGMDALVEVHDEDEMQRATVCGASLIGVNNRNLQTFEVSLETSMRLIGQAPPNSLVISESGLDNATDLHRLHKAGYSGFLIGESLMRAESPRQALELLTNSK